MGFGIGVLQGLVSGIKDIQARGLEMQRLELEKTRNKQINDIREKTLAQQALTQKLQFDQKIADVRAGLLSQLNLAQVQGLPPDEVGGIQERLAALDTLQSQYGTAVDNTQPEPQPQALPSAPSPSSTKKPSGQQSSTGALPRLGGISPRPAGKPEKAGGAETPAPLTPAQRHEMNLNSIIADRVAPGTRVIPQGRGLYVLEGSNAEEQAKNINEQLKVLGIRDVKVEGQNKTLQGDIKEMQASRSIVDQIIGQSGAGFELAYAPVYDRDGNLAGSGEPIGFRKVVDPELPKGDPDRYANIATEDLSPEKVHAILTSINGQYPEGLTRSTANVLATEVYPMMQGWVYDNTDGVGPDRVFRLSSDSATTTALIELKNGIQRANDVSSLKDVGYSIRPPTPDEAMRRALEEIDINTPRLLGMRGTEQPVGSDREAAKNKLMRVFSYIDAFGGEGQEDVGVSPLNQRMIIQMLKDYGFKLSDFSASETKELKKQFAPRLFRLMGQVLKETQKRETGRTIIPMFTGKF